MSKTKILNTIPEDSPLSGMYREYFLDYASYVILERAVPLLNDGLKPVQRRLLHALRNIHDGRFHKVANVIGQTMQYHPHGDASIGDALVKLGQKELLLDTQGNWGDARTGDRAAAPRYIEVRLSKFVLDVAYNPAITEWKASYDGRNKEPVSLPVKFPLLLTQGAEGIAVGLATKILPHNFVELCKASVNILQGKSFKLIPDFLTGGMLDASNYQKGVRGGKIRCRAHINELDKKTLQILSVPYGVTTNGLMDSIVKANAKGKIKIKKVTDNTAKEVEIRIELATGVSPDLTIDALYAFTDCEVSISPNCCVILDDKPVFVSVHELLTFSTEHTKELLKKELEVKLSKLKERLLFSSLEKIFIENRIYRDIEECETWESVIETIDRGLDPYKSQFYRKITEEDIVRLTEIKIKRISKFDKFKADELMRKLEDEIKEVEHHLANLVEYAIDYFKGLLSKYGKGRERRTEVMTFDEITAKQVIIASEKLYVNRKEGFVGTSLKKSDENVEFVADCSPLDDVIVFRKNGKYSVTKVSDKTFTGKDIIHIAIWRKGDKRKVYHAIYRDPILGRNFVKRFSVSAITRDRDYDVTTGSKGVKLLHFHAHLNSQSEIVQVKLSQGCRAKKKVFEFDFADLAVKGRNSKGNVLTKYPVTSVRQLSIGASTLGGQNIWIDETIGRINTDERGRMLGAFDTDERILVLLKDGSYELTNFELTNRYDMKKIAWIGKWDPKMAITAVHYDGERKDYFVKRFVIETTNLNDIYKFIAEAPGSKPIVISAEKEPHIQFIETRGRNKVKEEVSLNLADFIEVKGWKSLGNKLSRYPVTRIKEIPSSKKLDEDVKVGDTIELDL